MIKIILIPILLIKIIIKGKSGIYIYCIHTRKQSPRVFQPCPFIRKSRLTTAINVPFGRCPCQAKLGWCWPDSLPAVFAGLAADRRKRPSGPALYFRDRGK